MPPGESSPETHSTKLTRRQVLKLPAAIEFLGELKPEPKSAEFLEKPVTPIPDRLISLIEQAGSVPELMLLVSQQTDYRTSYARDEANLHAAGGFSTYYGLRSDNPHNINKETWLITRRIAGIGKHLMRATIAEVNAGNLSKEQLNPKEQLLYNLASNWTDRQASHQAALSLLADDQKNVDLQTIFQVGTYLGYSALPSPLDVGVPYLVGLQTSPNTPVEIIGATLPIDSAASGDWYNRLRYLRYTASEWNQPWLMDASFALGKHNPTNDHNPCRGGQPGWVIISKPLVEEFYRRKNPTP